MNSSANIFSAKLKIRQFQDGAPVDVKRMAESFGLRVWESILLGTGISGKLMPDRKNGGSAGYSILVNADEPLTRKRFTIAHELAHFILHRDFIGEGFTEDAFYRGKLSNWQEAQANRLAADILMPIRLIIPIRHHGSSVLAKEFEVSEAAMKIRLEQTISLRHA